MQPLFKRILVGTLIFLFFTVQAAAFDLQIGQMNFGPPPAHTAGHYPSENSGLGARITIPLGFSKSEQPTATLNGQDISQFTQEDAKDSLIVLMLFGVAIAVGALTVSAASN